MLEKKMRMKKTKDFASMATKGRTVFGPYATLRFRPIKDNELKVAFIISTKVFKRSVDRNLAKRRFRNAFREVSQAAPKGMHMLFILKPEAKDVDYEKIKEDIARMLEKIPETLKKPVQISPRARKELGKGKLQVGARFIKPRNK